MKTTIERIFETLSKEKVELKAEKIELALVDDFGAEFTKANKLVTSAYNEQFKIESAIQEMLNKYDAAGKSYLKANARYQEIEQASKDLGVEISGKLKASKQAISEALKEIDSASRELLKAKKMSFV